MIPLSRLLHDPAEGIQRLSGHLPVSPEHPDLHSLALGQPQIIAGLLAKLCQKGFFGMSPQKQPEHMLGLHISEAEKEQLRQMYLE